VRELDERVEEQRSHLGLGGGEEAAEHLDLLVCVRLVQVSDHVAELS